MTLSDRRLIVTTDGRRTETLIADDAALLAAYRTHFGIVLERPRLDDTAGLAGRRKPAQFDHLLPGKRRSDMTELDGAIDSLRGASAGRWSAPATRSTTRPGGSGTP